MILFHMKKGVMKCLYFEVLVNSEHFELMGVCGMHLATFDLKHVKVFLGSFGAPFSKSSAKPDLLEISFSYVSLICR